MAQKGKSPVYYVRTADTEIGPFRTKEGALAEARALKADGEDVKIRREFPSADAKGRKKKSGDDDFFEDDEDDEDDDDFSDLFDDDDEDDEGDDDFSDLFDDDDEDDEGDEDDDREPSPTHGWFRKIGKGS